MYIYQHRRVEKMWYIFFVYQNITYTFVSLKSITQQKTKHTHIYIQTCKTKTIIKN